MDSVFFFLYMLEDQFYKIQTFAEQPMTGEPTGYRATVTLNPAHAVFGGHFPGNPVVPGVCQVQMVKELLEKATGCSLRLTASDNIKFLSMIDPTVHSKLEFTITVKDASPGTYSATARVAAEGTVFLKFKGLFEREN